MIVSENEKEEGKEKEEEDEKEGLQQLPSSG